MKYNSEQIQNIEWCLRNSPKIKKVQHFIRRYCT